MSRLLVAAVASAACLCAAAAVADEAAPTIPEGAVQVGDSVKACSGEAYARFYEHRYQTKPLPAGQEFDVMLVGVFHPAEPARHGPPLVWLWFGSRLEVVDVVLTLPGRPVERLTDSELTRRWPHICMLIEDLHR